MTLAGLLRTIQLEVSSKNRHKKVLVIYVSAVMSSRLLVHMQERQVDHKSLFLSIGQSINYVLQSPIHT